MKRFFAALLAVMLIFSLCVTATADTTPKDPASHSYKAYQVFAGKEGVNAAEKAVLSDIKWGTGVDGDALLVALQADSTLGATFEKCSTAKDVAGKMAGWSEDSAEAQAFAKLAYANKTGNGIDVVSTATVAAGYYVIADISTVAGEDTVRNLLLLQLTKNEAVNIKSKVDVPVFEKKVMDVNDSTGVTSDWQDSADYDIGDAVPFKLTAKLGTIEEYSTYKVEFYDTQAAGFDAPGAFTVKIDGGTALTKDVDYTVAKTGNDFTITISDVIALGAKNDSVVTVEYSSALNSEAALGAAGNANTAYIKYSNDINASGSTGKSPEDTVKVFTYSVTINKVDEEGAALEGAQFTLSKYDKATESWTVVAGGISATDAHMFVWSGIDDGNYKLEETVTPTGYNTIAPLEFTVSAAHDQTADNPALTELYGGDLETGELKTNFKDDGNIMANVVNYAGSVLPETGGIGTTIFYAVGGVLVVAALVLLITKKRMGQNG